jgi:outer membrane protein assembly factor BamB
VYAWTIDGTFRWHSQRINDLAFDAPTPGSNQLYITGEFSAYALNIANGKITWHSAVGATDSRKPLYDHGTLFLALQRSYREIHAQKGSSQTDISSIIALDGRTGSLIWEKKNMNRPTIHMLANRVLYVDQVYNGHVYAISTANHATLWSFTHPIPNPLQPQGSGDSLIVIP